MREVEGTSKHYVRSTPGISVAILVEHGHLEEPVMEPEDLTESCRWRLLARSFVLLEACFAKWLNFDG